MTRARIAAAVAALSVSLVASFAFLFAANWLAERYLRVNPHLLMTREDRINENTRAVRERMIAEDKAALYFDLADASERIAMWREFYEGSSPKFESYTHFRPGPFQGKYYGVTEAGYRLSRDPGPWPPSREHYNVFFFGGSTAFGVGPYWATVASYLQDAMNRDRLATRAVRVYNFGRSGYFSTQEAILFANLLREGRVPDLAVFFDGLNDFCWADGQPSSWQFLARSFDGETERYRRLVAGHGIATQWRTLVEFLGSLPLVRGIEALRRPSDERLLPRYDAAAPEQDEPVAPAATLAAIMERYLANVRMVRAIAREYGVQTAFVWQPIPTYKYDLRYHLFKPDRLHCHVNSRAGYPLMAARVGAAPPGPDFIWAADLQDGLAEPLYVDAFHYTAPMSRKIAEFIWGQLGDRRLVAR